MNYLYAMLALEIVRERTRATQQDWLAASLAADRPARTMRLRRQLARMLATVSRIAAGITRRLDSPTADDLGRALAPAE